MNKKEEHTKKTKPSIDEIGEEFMRSNPDGLLGEKEAEERRAYTEWIKALANLKPGGK